MNPATGWRDQPVRLSNRPAMVRKPAFAPPSPPGRRRCRRLAARRPRAAAL